MAMSWIARVVVSEAPYRITQLLEMFGKWDNFISRGLTDEEVEEFRCYKRTVRPLGTVSFIDRLEKILGRIAETRPQRGIKKIGIYKINADQELIRLS